MTSCSERSLTTLPARLSTSRPPHSSRGDPDRPGAGNNCEFSSAPYLLQANLLGGATQPSCPEGISYPNARRAANPPVVVPSGVNTLFLVDTQRLTAAFGASAEATIMSNLEAVASGTVSGGQPGETDVNGAIIPVDAYSSVQNAYSQLNSNPCSV